MFSLNMEILCRILLVPHNNVMDLNNAMLICLHTTALTFSCFGVTVGNILWEPYFLQSYMQLPT